LGDGGYSPSLEREERRNDMKSNVINYTPPDPRERFSSYDVPDENTKKWSPYAGKFTGPGLFQEEVARIEQEGGNLDNFNPHSCTWKNRGGN